MTIYLSIVALWFVAGLALLRMDRGRVEPVEVVEIFAGAWLWPLLLVILVPIGLAFAISRLLNLGSE